ncbi:hypothetical protein ACP2AV_00510 [Aliiroseovarius sp. PTFE2010]|uniref:hypothetical protein n=1 Tax=Aliiroseovarius sp. PTFE2010 TaxID=3417190 RepID=UPI003CE8DA84
MMTSDDKPNIHLKRMIDAERRHGPDGSSHASKAVFRKPRQRGHARTGQYARIERGVET